MDSLTSLKSIADYDQKIGSDSALKSIFGSSKKLEIKASEGKESIEVVAPRPFFGHDVSWIVGRSQEQKEQQVKLRAMISQQLLQTGIGFKNVERIMTQVMSRKWSNNITRRDLRQMIARAEALSLNQSQPAESKPVSRTASTVSLTESDTDESAIFSNVDPQAEKRGADLIGQARGFLKEMPFQPKEVFKLRQQVDHHRVSIEAFLSKSQPASNVSTADLDKLEEEVNASFGPQAKDQIVLSDKTRNQLEEQRDHLIMKEKMLSRSLEKDPFNDKNVLYLGNIYAEAAMTIVANQDPKDISDETAAAFGEWHDNAINAYKEADITKHSKGPAFYLDQNNPENPFVKYSANNVVDELAKIGIRTSKKEVKAAVATIMNETSSWDVTRHQMVFSLGEKTGAYEQVSTPLSEGATAVASALQKQAIGGLIPSVRYDGRTAINARTTQLFKKENNKTVLLHERQQHGINDHFAIKDEKRRDQANVDSMRQLIQSGAETDAAFIEDAIKSSNSQQSHQLFYINTNLTTPTWTPRGDKNNERIYSQNQGKAMQALEGAQTFSVQPINSNTADEQKKITLDVTCIDFRFPVNYAISDVSEDARAFDPGMIFVWPELKKHNEGEFKKLFGSLKPDSPIGGIMESTCKKLAEKAATGDQDAIRVQGEIDLQIEYIRNMMGSEAYKRAGNDRFKMPRHIDLLTNAFRQASELVDGHKTRVVNAGGCMSGKDREGVANAENEAAIIVQDLGGSILPGEGGRYNDETKAIYDSCMTGVVHNTRQVTGIGGSKNAKEIKNQISDPAARTYAQGGSSLVSA